MHYRETGKRGKKVIPLSIAEGIHGRKMQWNTPFQGCSSSSSLIVDTYCMRDIEFGIFSARANVDPLSIR